MRKILMIFAALLIWAGAAAQTPVEELVVRYGEEKGVKDFVARGARMSLVRGFLGNYGLAPIADEVDQLYVMKLGNASAQVKDDFLADFKAAVKTYEYYGKTEGKNGVVDVYVLISGPETVSELVVYNPEIYVLNSLGGNFSVSSLLSLVNK
ncbi:MAG: DUF4252 domain-containing protein [Bacteroidales bacterium]|nr:DUF4252 domain-containing protein [Bacteroidales bacterium]